MKSYEPPPFLKKKSRKRERYSLICRLWESLIKLTGEMSKKYKS